MDLEKALNFAKKRREWKRDLEDEDEWEKEYREKNENLNQNKGRYTLVT